MSNAIRVRVLQTLAVLLVATSLPACGPQVSEQSQRLAESLIALGRESYEAGDLGDALRKGLLAVEKDPRNPDATYFVGFVYAARGELADAERFLRKTLELDDTYTDARNTLGQVLNNQGRFDEAIPVLEEASRDVLYPLPHLVEANLGQAHMEAGNLDEAISWLLRAAREEPRFCVAFFRLGDAFQRKGDDTSAEDALRTAVEIDDPACYRLQAAWRMLGEVRLRLGDRAGAAEAFAVCRDVEPQSLDGAACAAAADQLGPPPAPAPVEPPA